MPKPPKKAAEGQDRRRSHDCPTCRSGSSSTSRIACPSCGGGLFDMKGQVETSEMIDVVEVSYRVVQVEQQKYVCKCGGCVETAPGPERAAPAAATRSRSR